MTDMQKYIQLRINLQVIEQELKDVADRILDTDFETEKFDEVTISRKVRKSYTSLKPLEEVEKEYPESVKVKKEIDTKKLFELNPDYVEPKVTTYLEIKWLNNIL